MPSERAWTVSSIEGKTEQIIKADLTYAAQLTDVDEVHILRMRALKSAEARLKERSRTIEHQPEQYSYRSVEDLLEGIRVLTVAEKERHQFELNRVHEEYLTKIVRTLDSM
jgi:hypothetical protein